MHGWVHVGSDGVITALGSHASTPPTCSGDELTLDAGGALVLPGLMDAHIHVCMLGESQDFLDLKSCDSIEALQEAVARKRATHDGTWVIGVNWDQGALGRYPTRHDLDAVCADTPVFLWRACWHIGVANTRALQLARVVAVAANGDVAAEPTTKSPPGGVIDVDAGGCPVGILRERAVEVMVAAMAKKTPDESRRYVERGLALCVARGLTAVQTNDEGCWAIYTQLQQEGKLPLRAFLTPNYDELQQDPHMKPLRPGCLPPTTATATATATAVPTTQPAGAAPVSGSDAASYLVVERVKIFADGSLGAETAALRTGGSKINSSGSGSGSDGDSSDHTGVLVHEAAALRDMVATARARGFRVEIHAIGDKAAEQVRESNFKTPQHDSLKLYG